MIPRHQPIPTNERGSLLIVAMLLCAVIGISLASYIRLGQSAMQLSHRSFYSNAAVNMAETGLEHAMWSINQMVDGNANAWDGWTTDSQDAWRSFTDANWNYGQGVSGSVRVFVENYLGNSAPKIVARSTIALPNGAPVEKWVEVQLRKRSKFANGLVAKDSIIFQGNASVDSWNSQREADGTLRSSPVQYSTSERLDNGSVGSISVAMDAVLVNNGDIWGYAATGGSDPKVGSKGTVLGEDSPSGVSVDPARVSTDFAADFEPVELPTNGTAVGSIGSSIGTTGTSTVIRYNGSITDSFTVKGDVTLILTAPAGTEVIKQTGNKEIVIETGGSLTIYTDGDIKIAGNGVANPNGFAEDFQVWGTSTHATPQSIDIKGNGELKATVYAPNATVFVNGNGDVSGSVVANDIRMVGNASFHYDESLAELDSGNPYGITSWKELTSQAQRVVYSSELAF